MAIALVQSKSVNSGAVVVSTLAVTLDTPPTPGNVLVLVGAVFSTGGATTIGADPNITWMYWTITGANNVSIFLAIGRVFTGAGSTYTLNMSNGGQCLAVCEYSGDNISVDRFALATGTSASPTTGTTGTTSKATQLWFAAISQRNVVTFSAPTNGFVILLQDKSALVTTQDRSLVIATNSTIGIGNAGTTLTSSVAGAYYGVIVTLQENPLLAGGGESSFGSSF